MPIDYFIKYGEFNKCLRNNRPCGLHNQHFKHEFFGTISRLSFGCKYVLTDKQHMLNRSGVRMDWHLPIVRNNRQPAAHLIHTVRYLRFNERHAAGAFVSKSVGICIRSVWYTTIGVYRYEEKSNTKITKIVCMLIY